MQNPRKEIRFLDLVFSVSTWRDFCDNPMIADIHRPTKYNRLQRLRGVVIQFYSFSPAIAA